MPSLTVLNCFLGTLSGFSSVDVSDDDESILQRKLIACSPACRFPQEENLWFKQYFRFF